MAEVDSVNLIITNPCLSFWEAMNMSEKGSIVSSSWTTSERSTEIIFDKS